MLAMRWVATSVAALIMIVVGGGETPFVVSHTSTSVVISTTAPTPSTTSLVETTTTTEPIEVIETIEPRYDIPKLDGIENALCPDWWQLAVDVGWTEEQLPILDRVMWNETRCQPDAISSTNDWGLVQINRKTWEPTVIENGWTMEDLLMPHIGLQMGLIVYNAAEDMGWCGWSPWFMSGSYCR